MRVPLTTRDFLDRAELVYGDRVGTGEEYEQLLDFDTEPEPWAHPDEDATATSTAGVVRSSRRRSRLHCRDRDRCGRATAG